MVEIVSSSIKPLAKPLKPAPVTSLAPSVDIDPSSIQPLNPLSYEQQLDSLRPPPAADPVEGYNPNPANNPVQQGLEQVWDVANKPLGDYVGVPEKINEFTNKGLEVNKSITQDMLRAGMPEMLASPLQAMQDAPTRATRVLGNTLNSLTSPLNAGLMAAGVFPAGKMPAAAAGAVFAPTMAVNAYESGKEAIDLAKKGEYGPAFEQGLQGGLEGAMAIGAGKGAYDAARFKGKTAKEAARVREALLPEQVLRQPEGLGAKSGMTMSAPEIIPDSVQPIGMEGMMNAVDDGLFKKSAPKEKTFDDFMSDFKEVTEKPSSPKVEEILATRPEYLDTIKRAAENVADQAPDSLRKKGIFGRGMDHVRDVIADATNKSTLLAKKYPSKAGGGELTYQVSKAHETAGQMRKFGFNQFEEAKKIGQKAKFTNKMVERISKALEDRGNAKEYLKSPAETEVFNRFKDVFDFFKTEMKARGMAVRDDYFTHIFKDNPKEFMDATGIPKEIASSFEQARKGDNKGYRKDPFEVLPKYINSMARSIGFKPAIEFYNGPFMESISKARGPGLKSLHEADPFTHRQYMEQQINPSPTKGGIQQKLRNAVYKSLNWSGRLALQNISQKQLAAMKTSSSGKELAQVVRAIKDPQIDAFLKSDNPALMGEHTEMVLPKKAKGPFPATESSNWNWSRAYGIGEAVAQSPQFKAFKKQGMSNVEATVRTLDNPLAREQAMRRADVLANETQFGSNPAFKQEMMNVQSSFAKNFMMFMQYPLNAAELMWRSVNPKNQREVTILKRGLQDPNASAAETSMALKELHKEVLPRMIKENPKDAKVLKEARKFLKQQIKDYDKILKESEPITSAKALKTYGKILAYSTMVDLIWGSAGYEVKQLMGDKKAKDVDVMKVVMQNLPVMNMYSRFGGSLSTPIQPTNPAFLTKMVPGVRAVDAIIPGQPVTSLIKGLFQEPKKKK